MRTPPTEPDPKNTVKLATLARNINLPVMSIPILLEKHGMVFGGPVLVKVLQAFQDGFTWAKAGAVLHSDPEMAMDMINRVAADLGQTLPPKPPMDYR